MVLGCLFTLIGYTLATLNTNVTAQTDDTPSEATFDKITCRTLVITDGEGKSRIALDSDEKGTGIFIVPKDNDSKILFFGERAGNVGVLVAQKNEEIFLGASEEIGASILIKGLSSEVTLGTNDKIGGYVNITADRKLLVSLGVGNKGNGVIQLGDQHGKGLIHLDFNDDGGHIAIFNKDLQNVLQAGVGDKGGGVISTRDKNGYRTGSLP